MDGKIERKSSIILMKMDTEEQPGGECTCLPGPVWRAADVTQPLDHLQITLSIILPWLILLLR